MKKLLCVLCLLLVPLWATAGGPGPYSLLSRGYSWDGSQWVSLSSDVTNRSLLITDYAHHEIHSGDSYTVSSLSASLGSGGTFNIYILTSPLPELMHFEYQADSTGEGEISLLGEVTITATGTTQEIFNRRRSSSNTCSATAFINCTFTGGKVLRLIRNGAGKTTPGSERSTSEFILKPRTAYVIQYTSRAAGVFVSLKADWYCHADY